jgi:peptide/nickel transport system substrate-binding protein
MGKASIGLRAAVLASVAAIALAACGGGSSGGGGGSSSGGGLKPQTGGTLTFLTLNEQFQDLDPQRNYTGEDWAFAQAYLQRALNGYTLSPDRNKANTLVPDLGTDTGTSSDGAKTWSWTIKSGIKYEDGSPVTCEDFRYGVSRTFATDVITNGPSYAIQYLDIPTAKDGSSIYKGPYVKNTPEATAAFNKAVVCDGNKITFHLNKPHGDFNYTAAMLAFSPVPKSADSGSTGGEKYDNHPISTGPYKIASYVKGNQLVLTRNPNWDRSTDSLRPAYPDKIVVKFGVDSSVIDQRMIQDSGSDQTAVSRDSLQPASLATVFGDPRFAHRRVNDLDAYAYYIAINTKHIQNLKLRQAIVAALDREQVRKINGGTFAGDLSDGVIKSNLPQDYAPTGLYDGLLGEKIPPSGNPDFAKKLIQESGQTMPTLQYDYAQSDTGDKQAAAIVASMKKAGINVKPNPIEAGQYYGIVLDPGKAGDLMNSGWGPDWPNASTIIPPLFTPNGGFDLSEINDPAFNKKVDEANAETNRDKQSTLWKQLNKEAMQQAWVIPTRAGRDQRLAGSKVHSASGPNGDLYLWAPSTSWPYPDMWVEH